MPDTKISALPADTLTGVEETVVVEASTSKKTTVDDLRNYALNAAGAGLFIGKPIRWITRGAASVVSAASTPEQDLQTTTVPAALLAATGDLLIFEAAFVFAANANTKQIRIKFGATTLIDSTALAHNAVRAYVWGFVKRTGAATQVAYAVAIEGTNNAAWSTALIGGIASSAPTETLSGAIVLKATVQQGAASADTTQDLWAVGYLPA